MTPIRSQLKGNRAGSGRVAMNNNVIRIASKLRDLLVIKIFAAKLTSLSHQMNVLLCPLQCFPLVEKAYV